MAIKIANNNVINDDKYGKFKVGSVDSYTEAQLQSKAVTGSKVGDTVYNSDKGQLVHWDGSSWLNVGAELSGGNSTWSADGFDYYMFTAPGVLTSSAATRVEAIIVGGGGGGGAGQSGGGGGAGGFLRATVTLSSGNNPVTVGSGGSGMGPWRGPRTTAHQPGTPGGPSIFGGVEAKGGGAIRGYPHTAADPAEPYGSGYGGTTTNTPAEADGTEGQGYPGGAGGGISSGGGGGAQGSGRVGDSPQYGRGGRGILVEEFKVDFTMLYAGWDWVIPNSEESASGWFRGVCGGGTAGTRKPNQNPDRNPNGQLQPGTSGGGGAGSERNQGRDGTSFGAGGGGGAWAQGPVINNYQGGNGYPGVVLIRFRP